MALATYPDLLAALATYAIRDDQTANWPVMVAMAEARLNRLLSVRQMVATVTSSVTGATDVQPTDFNGAKALRLTSGSFPKLDPVSVDRMDELKAQADVSGEPTSYSVSGLNFEFFPEPATATPYRLQYYQNIPALSIVSTNWLLTSHPDAYLYASLVHFGIMAQDERLQAWEQALEGIISEISRNDVATIAGDRLTTQSNQTIV